MRWALRKAYFLTYDVVDRISGQHDDLVPPRSWIYDGGVDDFKRNGEIVMRQKLIAMGGLQPDDAVLDIGCGIGRLAVALTQYLNTAGRYDGIDIVPHGIEWCRTHISPRFPNFQFHLSDIYNKEYNPMGKLRARDYSFPFNEATFDYAFLISVFTHMLPDDLEHYIAEIARVLKPGGRCLATFYLLNEESLRLMAEGRSAINYKHDCGIYRIASTRVPELYVAYDETYAVELFRKYGLDLYRPSYYGGWDGRNGGAPSVGQHGHQDTLVTYKVTPSGLS
jgi:SAM-dependent methyltransferase